MLKAIACVIVGLVASISIIPVVQCQTIENEIINNYEPIDNVGTGLFKSLLIDVILTICQILDSITHYIYYSFGFIRIVYLLEWLSDFFAWLGQLIINEDPVYP